MAIKKRSESELRKCGYGDEEIAMFRRIDKEAETLEKEIDELESTGEKKDFLLALKKRRDLSYLEYIYLYGGTDPKKIDKDVLLSMLNMSYDSNTLETKARRAIKNRATAIRAFCIICMGGSYAEVRRCESVKCPLWPFRMGKDPLRSPKKLKVGEEFIEVNIDEDISDDEIEAEENA